MQVVGFSKQKRTGNCVVLTEEGGKHQVSPSRLSIVRTDNGVAWPTFNPETKKITCGSEEAEKSLQGMLARLAAKSCQVDELDSECRGIVAMHCC